MASIARKRTIQFTDRDGRRRTLSLGRLNLDHRQVRGMLPRIDSLVAAQASRQAIDPETARWLGEIGAGVAEKLAQVGLIPSRESVTLKAFLDSYITARADVKPTTRTHYGHTRRCLIAFFGADKPLRDITPGDADDWRLWMIGTEKLADNTARRRCGYAKQFFHSAVRKGYVSVNPFAHLAGTVCPNTKRLFYVTRSMADRVLAACPDAEWRLIFALARYGGLRCPSEHLALKWSDIDWGGSRITVHSPKTEHLVGGESRQIPIFPELRPYLEAAEARRQDGQEYVVTRARDPKVNLRKFMTTIIRRAGLTPWPKLFQNLRSTRETELAERYPLHLVTAWIGNTKAVAAKFYLQVRDEDFERAARGDDVDEALHGALQQALASGCNEAQPKPEPAFCGPSQPVAAACSEPMGRGGVEPPTQGFSDSS